MKKTKILSVLLSFCTVFAVSFSSLAKGKVNSLKEILKKEYKIDYVNSVDLQKEIEKGITTAVKKREDKELAKTGFRFAICLATLFKEDDFWVNGEFKDFVLKNFVKKKFDFVDYDKAVFKKMKSYFEDAYEKSKLVLANVSKVDKIKDKKIAKEVENLIDKEFKNLILQSGVSQDKKMLKKIKKDFENKKGEFYNKFLEELKKGLKYYGEKFKDSIECLEKFKKEKAFRVKINKKLKNFSLKDFFEGIEKSTKLVEQERSFIK